MKKKVIIGLIVLALVIIAIAIPKSTYQRWFGKKDENNNIEQPTNYQRIFVVNEKNKLVGVNVPVNQIEEDQITQKWNLLTSNMNLIPTGYSSPITPSTLLESYTIENAILTMNVSEDIIRSAGKLAIDSLAWTFCNEEIKEVLLKVEDKVVTDINEYSFTKIRKENGTNYTYETAYLLESDYTTIIYYQDDTILPVTYFYDSKIKECDYLISKVLTASALDTLTYKYELVDNRMKIDFSDLTALSDPLRESLEATLCFNFDIDSITINGKDSVLYEKTFVKVNS